jgi:hypothetical protein
MVLYSYLYVQKDAKIKAKEYSFSEVSDLIKEGKSLIRFGDGEVHIINYGSIHYENYSVKLRNIFLEILTNYKKESPYILGLNTWALEKSNTYLKAENQFYCWLPLKAQYLLTFPKDMSYFDAALFYRRNVFEEYVLPNLKDKHIILISKKDNCEHIKQTNFFDSISYVVTPDLYLFTKYSEIKKETDTFIEQNKSKKIVLLVSCGPASKAICFEYANNGVQSIDIGIGLELIGTGKGMEHMLL